MNKIEVYERYDSLVTCSWSVPPTTSEYSGWATQAQSRFANLLPLDRTSRILDLGCGAGHLLYFLRQKGFANICGVDACPGAVKRANAMALPVQFADIFSFLENTDQTFDCITAIDIVEHFTREDLDRLFRLIRMRLNCGGLVIFQTINGNSPWCQSYFAGDLTHETLFTPRSLAALLGLNGFSEIVAQEVVPPPAPIRHGLRLCAWKFLRIFYAMCNFIETGTGYSGIYSRNVILRATLTRS
jgi:2-polyprenyl-3-methyl-5-hydroxy-6-metoxy-1,4-benzoquinol methylase